MLSWTRFLLAVTLALAAMPFAFVANALLDLAIWIDPPTVEGPTIIVHEIEPEDYGVDDWPLTWPRPYDPEEDVA